MRATAPRRGRYQKCERSSVWVALVPSDLEAAKDVTERIWERVDERGYRDLAAERDGLSRRESMNRTAVGYLAEICVRRWLRLPTEFDIEGWQGPDIAELGIEVKAHTVDWHGLRVQEHTPDEARVVGVVIHGWQCIEAFRIMGWYPAGDAKRREWAMNPNNGRLMYAVPQKELHHIDSLPALP